MNEELTTRGGPLRIAAKQHYTDTKTATVTAKAVEGAGGSIEIKGTQPDSTLAATGFYAADSAAGTGGSITMVADAYVSLQGASLDVSGGFDEDDAADQRSAAAANEFLQSIRVVKRVEKVEKRLEHATWFLFAFECDLSVSAERPSSG